MGKNNFTISFSWDVNKRPDNAERVGAMYCFKKCDVNVFQKRHSMEELKITLNWEENNPSNRTRVGAMYCFKNCDIHYN